MAFPLLRDRKRGVNEPVSVPFDLVKDHEGQAQRNHSQTLTRLAERGGLSPRELWSVVNDKHYRDSKHLSDEQILEWLRGVDGVEWSAAAHPAASH